MPSGRHPGEGAAGLLRPLRNDLRDRLRVVKLRLLRKIPDVRALGDMHSPHQIRIDSGQYLEERGLARAVAAYHAYVRTIEEAEVDVLKDRLGANLLRHINQTELILTRHFISFLGQTTSPSALIHSQ